MFNTTYEKIPDIFDFMHVGKITKIISLLVVFLSFVPIHSFNKIFPRTHDICMLGNNAQHGLHRRRNKTLHEEFRYKSPIG